ncbi:NHX-3 protein [Aphelenchoides avenae]|nr:NHX-3 protein [Aphelenchus avenae]
MQRLLFGALVALFAFEPSRSQLVDIHNDTWGDGEHFNEPLERFHVVEFQWEHVQSPLTVVLWLLFACMAKCLLQSNKKMGDSIPDSALLIIVGLVLGLALGQFHLNFSFSSSIFFLALLPPIVFEGGYSMPVRQLLENLDSVMMFAAFGTVFNILVIGGVLFLMGEYQFFSVEFSAFEILLFASLISSTDPVAVIAIFEELHVNEFLFINVFGESLLNDGVAVVMYQMLKKFVLIGTENLIPVDFVAGGLSFFPISFGGVFMGIIFRHPRQYAGHVWIAPPVFIFTVPYLAYLVAELFGLSAILAALHDPRAPLGYGICLYRRGADGRRSVHR